MKLIIDIGNSITKIALFEAKKIVVVTKLKHCDLQSVNDFVSNRVISKTIISSVKKSNSDILNVANYYNAFILSNNLQLPIKNKYKTPDTLGQDRLALVIGAHALYPNKDIIAFDAGTCLTIDFITQEGEYIGGRISPGIEMRYKALNTFTDNLPLVKTGNNTIIIGNDTKSSVISGVQYGILTEVKSAISDYRLQYPNCIAIITGGDCFFFEKELKNSIFANPNLVLIGLNEILDINE